MLAGLLFVAFFAIALAGVPLLYALLTTTVGAVVIAGLGHPLESIFLFEISISSGLMETDTSPDFNVLDNMQIPLV